MTSGSKQQSAGIADKATTGAEAHARDPRQTTWAKASVWTERMLSALVNGVQGGKWYSLMDKLSKTAPPSGVCTQDADAGLDENSSQQGRCGRGWAEHWTVRGKGRAVSVGAVGGTAGWVVPTAGRQAGGHPEGRWQDETVGHSDSQRPHRPTGGPARDRADFRKRVRGGKFRLSSGTRMP